MGLDQYAYTSAKENDWEKSRELAYWRKHPNLQGWMEQLWYSKQNLPLNDGKSTDFNGIELELTWEDLDKLEQDVLNDRLPPTTGFFFGNPSDSYYKEHDLKFIRQARAEIFSGLRVFYNSSW